MDELLKKLLESELLTSETKKELEEAFRLQLEEVKKQTEIETRAQLTEQWINERDALIEAIDVKVQEFLVEEMNELKKDIENFRDLEAEYAGKIVEEKTKLAQQLNTELDQLVENLDTFLEMRLAKEFSELREDIEEVRKANFGRKIFEQFVETFKEEFVDEDSVEAELHETKHQLNNVLDSLAEAEAKLASFERDKEMDKVLAPLSGKSRDIMEAILSKVETNQLAETYTKYLSHILREAEEKKDDKKEVVVESTTAEAVSEGVLMTGDNKELLERQEAFNVKQAEANKSPEFDNQLKKLKNLAGI